LTLFFLAPQLTDVYQNDELARTLVSLFETNHQVNTNKRTLEPVWVFKSSSIPILSLPQAQRLLNQLLFREIKKTVRVIIANLFAVNFVVVSIALL
jgi:hypothetical protein